MYTTTNYKTKADIKRALLEGKKITVFQPNDMFSITHNLRIGTHDISLEGPHSPQPHRWYAEATVVNGYIVKFS